MWLCQCWDWVVRIWHSLWPIQHLTLCGPYSIWQRTENKSWKWHWSPKGQQNYHIILPKPIFKNQTQAGIASFDLMSVSHSAPWMWSLLGLGYRGQYLFSRVFHSLISEKIMSERVKCCLGGHPESQGRDEAATQNLAGPEGFFSSESESPCFLTFQTDFSGLFL